MRRLTSLLAATLVLGVQALLTTVPVVGGAGVKSHCSEGPGISNAGRACCGAGSQCSTTGHAECAAHAGAAHAGVAPAPASSCLRPLGCGHSLPGVMIPSLDPLVMQAHTTILASIDGARIDRDAPATSTTFRPEPLAPPPRA